MTFIKRRGEISAAVFLLQERKKKMTSIVALCNRALSKIGDEPVLSSLNDDTKAARYCKALYADTRDFVLRSYPWRFALKRYALAPLKDKPLYGYEYRFGLPADCLRVWRTEDEEPYQVEGQNVLYNAPILRFVGIARVEDTAFFDPMFVEALALKLAAELAVPLTASVALKETLNKEYQAFVQQAKTASAMEGAQDGYTQRGWLEATI